MYTLCSTHPMYTSRAHTHLRVLPPPRVLPTGADGCEDVPPTHPITHSFEPGVHADEDGGGDPQCREGAAPRRPLLGARGHMGEHLDVTGGRKRVGVCVCGGGGKKEAGSGQEGGRKDAGRRQEGDWKKVGREEHLRYTDNAANT